MRCIYPWKIQMQMSRTNPWMLDELKKTMPSINLHDCIYSLNSKNHQKCSILPRKCTIIPPMKHEYMKCRTYASSNVQSILFFSETNFCFYTVICFGINNVCSQRRQKRNHVEHGYPLKTFQNSRNISTLHSYAMSFPLHSFYLVSSYFFWYL